MARLRVHCFSISADGYGAGPRQSLNAPLGAGGEAFHEWMFPTRTFRAMQGEEGGETGLEDDLVAAGFEGIGATIMGRNMFGPVRGQWPDHSWKGWWGDNPPYHHPVFVLTNYARPPLPMEGGTTFFFVTEGIEAAFAQASAAAKGLDVRLGGGVSTIHQYLRAGFVDELHIAITPVLLGAGERLFEDAGTLPMAYDITSFTPTANAAHLHLVRKSQARA